MTTCIEPFEPTILRHPSLPLSVHVLPYGLTIHRILFTDPESGSVHDVIVGPEDPKDHHDQGRCFMGPLVGRYANRLPSGRHSFPGGQVDLPEWGGNGICHHGGPETAKDLPAITVGTVPLQPGPLDRLVWSRIPSSVSRLFGAESPSIPGSSSSIFAITSPADSNGFPGTLRIEARIALVGKSNPPQIVEAPALGRSAGSIRIEYRAHIIDDCEATPINVTHHWGFNLSASEKKAREEEGGRIDDHFLRFIPHPGGPAIRRLDVDEKGVATGKLIDAPQGDAHDFESHFNKGFGRKIGSQMPEGGFDHFYTWGNPRQASNVIPFSPAIQQGADPTRCILHSPSANLSLVFRTNQVGVQLYTANGQPAAPAPARESGGRRKLLHDGAEAGQGNAQRSAAFLEFGMPHTTFLSPELTELAGDDTVLRQRERYGNWVEVELWKA